MESATTTAAVEATSSSAATESAAALVTVVAAGKSASHRVRSAIAAAISVTGASVAITGTSVPVAAAITVAAAIAVNATVSISVAAIPGAGPNKDAAVEPRRPIVPVRRTSIRIVAVIAIGADGSRVAVTVSPIDRATDPHTDRHLAMRISRSREQQDTEYSEVA